jgi:hypothetical protein
MFSSVEQATGERNAADGSSGLILLPAGAGQVAARHALHGKHGCALHQHGSVFQLAAIGLQRGGEVGGIGLDQVVGNKIPEQIEPEERYLGEDFPLSGNAGGEDMIEGGNPVGGHHQQRTIDRIEVPDLAPAKQRNRAQIGSQENCHRKTFLGGN